MMAPLFEVLYYPNFEPSELWLRRYLMVYDKVWSVIPKDARHNLSKETQIIMEAIPNSFDSLSPLDVDKSPDGFSLDRLDKAFAQIQSKKTTSDEKRKIVLRINLRNLHTDILGSYSFLHSDKFNRRVQELLEKHNLYNADATEIYESLGGSGNFLAIDPEAANIIMSNLADNIARRKGFNTITDQNIPFLVTSLNSLNVRSPLKIDSRDWLISSLVRFEIPAEIELLSLKDYKTLRNSYAEMRFAFHAAVTKLNSIYRLDRIDDLELLRDKVKAILSDLDKEIKSYKETGFGKKIIKWVPFTIGNLFTLGGAASGLSGEKMLSAACKGASVVFKTIDKAISSKDKEGEKEQLVRMLSGIQKELIKTTDVKKLI